MKVCPISFQAQFKVALNQNGVDKQKMNTEINTSLNAKKLGVDVPKYQITSFEYKTKGETADFYQNPITEKHLKNIFKNLYLLDKNEINHNDLDISHVFYAENGEVEIDCFRFSEKFNQEQFPNFQIPTNQTNYENASLTHYVSSIFDSKAKKEFLKNYLQESSEFHGKKAGLIIEKSSKKQNGNIEYSLEKATYENFLSQALKNPDDDKVDLFEKKLDFLSLQRKAFTEWDEGNGACGHNFNPERRLKAIPMYLEASKKAIEYSFKAEELKEKSSTSIDKVYYDYESQIGSHYANMYLSWIQGMADYNFQDERVFPLELEKRKNINEKFQEIINAKLNAKSKKIDEYIALYNSTIS